MGEVATTKQQSLRFLLPSPLFSAWGRPPFPGFQATAYYCWTHPRAALKVHLSVELNLTIVLSACSGSVHCSIPSVQQSFGVLGGVSQIWFLAQWSYIAVSELVGAIPPPFHTCKLLLQY